MFSYYFIQWVSFFYLYCFLGWCIESSYVSIKNKVITNRGFMHGPFLPLYGSGAIMMLVVSRPFQNNLFLVFLAGCIGATVLEYITGVVMEALFKVRYWDYSTKKINFQGHICLGTTLSWGVLTILMTKYIHQPIEKIILAIPIKTLAIFSFVLTIFIVADLTMAFKAALDLRDLLFKMEKAKEELIHVQKRLDMLITLVDEGITNKKDILSGQFENKMDIIKENIEFKLDRLKTIVQGKKSANLEHMGDELLELKVKYRVNLEKREALGKIKDFYKKNHLKSNPSMTSVRFKEALEELKKKL